MSSPGQNVSPEVTAVIAAAVALALDKPHRVLSVKLAVPQDTTLFVLNPWPMEGRFEIFRSHRVR